jgi:hypothetical protein
MEIVIINYIHLFRGCISHFRMTCVRYGMHSINLISSPEMIYCISLIISCKINLTLNDANLLTIHYISFNTETQQTKILDYNVHVK